MGFGTALWLGLAGVASAGGDRDALHDAVVVGAATLGGTLVGAYGGMATGAVVSLPVCGLDSAFSCFESAALVGTVAGIGVGGATGAALGAIPADVRSGRTAQWTVAPALVGATLWGLGMSSDRESARGLVPAGLGVMLAGIPLAAAVAAATDDRPNGRSRDLTLSADLRVGHAGLRVAGTW